MFGSIDSIGIKHQVIKHVSDNAKGGNADKSSAHNRDEFDGFKQALEQRRRRVLGEPPWSLRFPDYGHHE